MATFYPIPDSIIQFEVFSFIHPRDFPSLLFSCSTFRHWIQESDSYKYSKLLLLLLRQQNIEYWNELSLPSLDFFSSKTADNIRLTIQSDGNNPSIGIPHHVFTSYSEPVCRELMKLFQFEIDDLSNVSWAQEDYRDLQLIEELDDNDEMMKLISQYSIYIPTVVNKLGKYMLDICVDMIDHIQDREVMLQVVKNLPYYSEESLLEHLPKQFTNDKEIVIHALAYSGIPDLYFASAELRNDRDVVMAAIKNMPYSLEYASDEMRSDRQVVMEAIKRKPIAFKYASQELRRDRNVCIAAINEDCSCLEWELCGLTDDREFILQLAKQYPYVIPYYSSPRLRQDRELLLESVKLGCVDWLTNSSLKDDGAFVFDCVSCNGLALSCVPRRFQLIRKYVLAAVKNNGLALEYTSQELKRDRALVTIAVNQTYRAFRYACNDLKDDTEFVKSFDKVQIIQYASERLRDDKEFVLSALQRLLRQISANADTSLIQQEQKLYDIGNIIWSLSSRLKDDEDVMMMAVSLDGESLYYGSERIKSNRDIVLKAVSKNPKALKYASINNDLKEELQ